MEALEGDLDSLTDDKEAVEFPPTDKLLSAESKEDVKEDTEEVFWAGVSWEEVQEDEEGVSWGEATLSVGRFSSLPFEELWEGEATGGEAGAVEEEEEPGSAAGEDGGEV